MFWRCLVDDVKSEKSSKCQRIAPTNPCKGCSELPFFWKIESYVDTAKQNWHPLHITDTCESGHFATRKRSFLIMCTVHLTNRRKRRVKVGQPPPSTQHVATKVPAETSGGMIPVPNSAAKLYCLHICLLADRADRFAGGGTSCAENIAVPRSSGSPKLQNFQDICQLQRFWRSLGQPFQLCLGGWQQIPGESKDVTWKAWNKHWLSKFSFLGGGEGAAASHKMSPIILPARGIFKNVLKWLVLAIWLAWRTEPSAFFLPLADFSLWTPVVIKHGNRRSQFLNWEIV